MKNISCIIYLWLIFWGFETIQAQPLAFTNISGIDVQEEVANLGGDTVHVTPPTGERETDRASILTALEEVEPGGTIQFAQGMYLMGGQIIRITVPRVTLSGHEEGTTLRGCYPDEFPMQDTAEFGNNCNGLELAVVQERDTLLFAEYGVADLEHSEYSMTLGNGAADSEGLDLAGYEDYRTPIGVMENDTLRITLEARPAEWRPWGPNGPAIYTHVFSADGEAPRAPGPLIRFKAGTPVSVTVRNTLPDTLAVRGLRDKARGGGLPGVIADQLIVPPAGEEKLYFTSTSPGTYSYSAERLSVNFEPDTELPGAAEADRNMRGLLVVDGPEETYYPNERFFLLTHWADEDLPATFLPATRFFINGRSWPHTERLTYAQGDTIRWRVVNFTGRIHPMHLHGFYFSVDAKGNLQSEQVYAPDERRLAVTELLASTETMRMSWVPEEPGNWIFHCHFMRHMSWIQTAPINGPPPSHAHDELEKEDLMGGLVLGVTVLPENDWVPDDEVSRRQLNLYINKKAHIFGEDPGYAFVLQNGEEPPAPDSLNFPGSPIILTRGEPTQINVHNQADVPLGVHWHGLELESWADGVPGWSGLPGSVSPAVQPGSSFSVRMTPPRAGTFMYHVHSEPGHQLAQGLYGPFLVMKPGEEYNPENDLYFLLGSLGTGDDPPAAVNGELEPEPIDISLGEIYRLRFMHISPDDNKHVSLLRGENPVKWQFIAKDGADLPASQTRTIPAELDIHVGETYDFLWTPEQHGKFALRIVTTFDRGVPAFPRKAPEPHTAIIHLNVH